MNRKTKPTVKLTPATELLLPSIKIIRDNWLTYFVLLVIPVTLGMMSNPMPRIDQDATVAEVFAAIRSTITPYVIGGMLLTVAFAAPLTYTRLKNAEGKLVSLDESFEGLQYFWRIVGVSALTALAIAGGFILFIVPGFIMMRRYIMAPFFLIDKNLSVIEAMKLSAKKTKPVSWSIYSIILVNAGFMLFSGMSMTAAIIGTLLSVLYSTAFALRYVEIR